MSGAYNRCVRDTNEIEDLVVNVIEVEVCLWLLMLLKLKFGCV